MLTRMRVVRAAVPAGIVMVPVTVVLLIDPGSNRSSLESNTPLPFRSTQIFQYSLYVLLANPGVRAMLYAVPAVMVMVLFVKSV